MSWKYARDRCFNSKNTRPLYFHLILFISASAPRATAIASWGESDSLPRVSGGEFAAARRLLSSGSRRGRLILVSGLDGLLIFIF